MDHQKVTQPGREEVQKMSVLVPNQSCLRPSRWERCHYLYSHWFWEDALILDCSSDGHGRGMFNMFFVCDEMMQDVDKGHNISASGSGCHYMSPVLSY